MFSDIYMNSLNVIVKFLSDICGNKFAITNSEGLYNYKNDETLDLKFPFDILVKPGCSEEIAEILKTCNLNKIPVTPKSEGSGFTGGALPVNRGVLLHKPKHKVSILAGFNNLETAYKAVVEIKQSSIVPSALELVGENALKITSTYLNEPLPLINDVIKCHLTLNLQDALESGLMNALETITTVLEKYSKTENILIGFSSLEQEKIWKLRLNIGSALTQENKIYRDIDICMPLSKIHDYIKKVESICKEYSITLTYFGHIFDGNLHTMLSLDKNYANDTRIKSAITEIYNYAISNGGVISGEHGIGLIQKEFMPLQFPEKQLVLMQKIKQLFDPNCILNPGKLV